MHTYRPRMRERPDGVFRGRDWFKWRNSAPCPDSTFNPLVFCACAMVDVGLAMRDGASKFADPAGRDRMNTGGRGCLFRTNQIRGAGRRRGIKEAER